MRTVSCTKMLGRSVLFADATRICYIFLSRRPLLFRSFCWFHVFRPCTSKSSGGGSPQPEPIEEKEEEEEESEAFEEELENEEEDAAPAEDRATPVADPDEDIVPEEDSPAGTEYDFIYRGCFEDDKANRIMTRMELADDLESKMTGEVCTACSFCVGVVCTR